VMRESLDVEYQYSSCGVVFAFFMNPSQHNRFAPHQ
jgi:hypothetical protein